MKHLAIGALALISLPACGLLAGCHSQKAYTPSPYHLVWVNPAYPEGHGWRQHFRIDNGKCTATAHNEIQPVRSNNQGSTTNVYVQQSVKQYNNNGSTRRNGMNWQLLGSPQESRKRLDRQRERLLKERIARTRQAQRRNRVDDARETVYDGCMASLGWKQVMRK